MSETGNRTKTIWAIVKIFLQIIWNILFYTVVILVMVRLCTAAYDFSYQIFGNVAVESAPGRDMAVEIQEAEGTMHIATKLENQGIVANRYSFFIRAKLSTGTKKPILPGSYKLNTSMTYDQIISVITNESQPEGTQ